MEKKTLGTSDTWSTSHLSHQPREPAYYIVDCWIFKFAIGGVSLALGLNFLQNKPSQSSQILPLTRKTKCLLVNF